MFDSEPPPGLKKWVINRMSRLSLNFWKVGGGGGVQKFKIFRNVKKIRNLFALL